MDTDKKLLLVARVLLLGTAIGIVLGSVFFYNPNNYPLGAMLNPQMGQTLVYGGFTILITLFAWWWPVPGGILAVLYGSYRLYEYLMRSGTSLTLVPAPVYYVLYSLFLVSGISLIYSGLRTAGNRKPDNGVHRELRQVARIATITPIAAAIVNCLIWLGIYALGISYHSPAGFLLSAIIFFSPLFLAVIYISWKWPVPGGILALIIGIPSLIGIVSANWGLAFVIPYAIYCAVLAGGGSLHLAWAFLNGKQKGTDR